MSLRQIANSTRISVMSLEALERSDLSRLPGGIFTRAFVRAYAQEVGLDPDRTIQDFIAELPPDAASATAHPVSVEDPEKLESDRRAVATALRLALISLPIIVLVMYYGTNRGTDEPAEGIVTAEARDETAAMSPGGLTDAPPASDALPPLAEPAAAPAAAPVLSGLTIEMAPRAACWVSVNADGEPTYSGLMRAGDTRTVTAKELIVLNVGDAGAFTYKLNGRPGRPLGGPGEVVSLRITAANLSRFIAP